MLDITPYFYELDVKSINSGPRLEIYKSKLLEDQRQDCKFTLSYRIPKCGFLASIKVVKEGGMGIALRRVKIVVGI